MLIILIARLLMLDFVLVFVRVIVSNRKLHKLNNNVLKGLLVFELVDEIIPTLPMAATHKVQ